MVIGRVWKPIYNILERVRTTEEEQKKLLRGKGWLRELSTVAPAEAGMDIDIEQVASPVQFQQAQCDDPELQHLTDEDPKEGLSSTDTLYNVRKLLLYYIWKYRGTGEEIVQLVVMGIFRRVVLHPFWVATQGEIRPR